LTPVSLDEVKGHAIIEHDDDNPKVRGMAKAAIRWVEKYTGRPLSGVWYAFYSRFPGDRLIELPWASVVSIDEVAYVATGTEAFAVFAAGGNYRTEVDSDQDFARVYLLDGIDWPSINDDYRGGAVRVQATLGYLAADADKEQGVPEDIKLAIQILTTHFYDNPQAVGTLQDAEAPFSVLSLLEDYRLFEFK
jgi:uncharacterized phiE125 gp8 family phage protein